MFSLDFLRLHAYVMSYVLSHIISRIIQIMFAKNVCEFLKLSGILQSAIGYFCDHIYFKIFKMLFLIIF